MSTDPLLPELHDQDRFTCTENLKHWCSGGKGFPTRTVAGFISTILLGLYAGTLLEREQEEQYGCHRSTANQGLGYGSLFLSGGAIAVSTFLLFKHRCGLKKNTQSCFNKTAICFFTLSAIASIALILFDQIHCHDYLPSSLDETRVLR